MNILLLGPECKRIEESVKASGHGLTRCEEILSREYLDNNQFDYGISYRYRHILKQDIIDWFAGKLINLHISVLPWNRGADPNFWSFIENTPKGVTIHKIDIGVDTGDILLQEECEFDVERDTLRSTYQKLSERIESLFISNMDKLFSGTVLPVKQVGAGTVHKSSDIQKYIYLIEEKGWDTPVSVLVVNSRG